MLRCDGVAELEIQNSTTREVSIPMVCDSGEVGIVFFQSRSNIDSTSAASFSLLKVM